MIKLGLFDDFKGDRTLLVWGDHPSMGDLRTALQALADAGHGRLLLTGLPGAVTRGELQVTLTIVGSGRAQILESATQDGRQVDIQCSPEQAADFADLVGALVRDPNRPAHQYIEVSAQQTIQVIVSMDEYPRTMGDD